MDASSNQGGFVLQDDPKEGPKENLEWSRQEIGICEPVVIHDFDIQTPDSQIISVTHAGSIKSLTRISEENVRHTLPYRSMRLFELWVIIGLNLFIVTGHMWLLTTAGLLGILVCYFNSSERKK